jgi:hypothetical protein
VKGEQITIGTAATVVAGSDGTGRGLAGGGSISLPTACLIRVPTGAQTVYLGGSQVTTGTGCPFIANEDVEVDLVNEILYGIVASGSQVVYVLRKGD